MILGAAAVLVGCNRTPTQAPSAAPPGAADGKGQFVDASGPHAAGKRVFATGGCTKCHTIGAGPAGAVPDPGQGAPPKKGWGSPKGMKRGPDLAKVARDPAHTVEWLMAYVRDPKSQNPRARMPAQNRLSDEDLRQVAEYLASLK
jgi:mono/diheme cytochrome c family protein